MCTSFPILRMAHIIWNAFPIAFYPIVCTFCHMCIYAYHIIWPLLISHELWVISYEPQVLSHERLVLSHETVFLKKNSCTELEKLYMIVCIGFLWTRARSTCDFLHPGYRKVARVYPFEVGGRDPTGVAQCDEFYPRGRGQCNDTSMTWARD